MTWSVHNVEPVQTDARPKPQQDCQRTKFFARADTVLHHKLYSNLLEVSGKHSYTNTQVYKILWHRNNDRLIGVTVFHHMHGSGRQPTVQPDTVARSKATTQ